MIKSRRSSPRLSAKQLQKQEKSNSIQSLLKVTPILNGDRMLLYLPTMRRFDFDSHLLPFQTTNVSSLSRIRRGKRKERDSTDPNPRRENDKEGEEETVAARKKRRCTGKRRERELYCIYRTLGNLHIDLPRKCVIHGSRTSRKQKLILARSWYSGEPIWIGDAGAHTGGGEGWKCEETTAWDGQVNETWAEGGRNLRGVDGGARKGAYDSPTCRSRRERGKRMWLLNETICLFFMLCGIFHLCVINKYVNSRNCKDENGEYDQLVNSNIDENSFQNELSSIRKSS